jgi:hypothetical protein
MTSRHHPPVAVPVPLLQPFWNNEVEGSAERLVAGIAEYPFRTRIPEADDAVAVRGDDRVRPRRKNSFAKKGGKTHDAAS